MQLEEFKEILLHGSDADKHKAMSNARLVLLNVETFNLLFELLKDNHPHNRFFAIFYLIDKFPKLLADCNDSFLTDIYNSLFDEFVPVADRAIWALSIIGDRALNKLIEKYHTTTTKTKTRIVIAIGRGNFSHRSNDRIQLLLDAVKSKNENLRFSALDQIMKNSSSETTNKWNSINDNTIDIEKIHLMLLPITKEFIKSTDNHFKNSSIRYRNWLEKNYT